MSPDTKFTIGMFAFVGFVVLGAWLRLNPRIESSCKNCFRCKPPVRAYTGYKGAKWSGVWSCAMYGELFDFKPCEFYDGITERTYDPNIPGLREKPKDGQTA